MLKARRILGRTLLIAALFWCGLWFLGRMALSDRLEGGIAALASEGVAIAHAGHAITGFPFGYEARFRDVALSAPDGGAALRLPELTGAVHVTAPDEVVARFPERFEAELTGADGAARRVDVESRGLSLTAEGLAGGERRAVLSADHLALNEPGGAEIAFTGFRASATGPALAPGTAPSGAAEARDVSFGLTLPAPQGGHVRIEARIGQARLSGATDLTDTHALSRMVAGYSRRPGRAQMTLTGETFSLSIEAVGTGEDSDGRIALTAAPARAEMVIDGGNLDATAALRGARIAVSLPGRRIDGSLAAGPVEGRYAMPLGPSEDFQPMAVRLKIDRAEPDGALWSGLDPEGTLPREPVGLYLDIGGTARLTKPFAAARAGEAPPVEPGTILVKAARLKGLGAGAEAEGEVAFTAGQAPTGEIRVILEGAVGFLRRLHEAGLIDSRRLQTLALTLAGLTRAGNEAGTLETRIAFDQGRVTVNGEPMR